VSLHCDRCKQEIVGAVPPTGQEMTAGYYHTVGSYWKRFADHGEHIVCDECMWKDPRYIKVYGTITRK